MSQDKKEPICPFPTLCDYFSEEGCTLKKENPLILCSLASIPPKNIPFTEKDVTEYLDRHILVWENRARYTRSEFAKFYVDAYQKIRKNLFGKEMELPPRVSGSENAGD